MKEQQGKQPIQEEGEKKKKKKNPRFRKRKTALLIRPANGKSYEETVLQLKKELPPKLAETGTELHRVRKTQNGCVLIEIKKTNDTNLLREAVEAARGAEIRVRSMHPKVKVEIRDLDGCTKEHEIKEALKLEFGTAEEDATFPITIFNKKGKNGKVMHGQMAVPELLECEAFPLVKKGKIKIG